MTTWTKGAFSNFAAISKATNPFIKCLELLPSYCGKQLLLFMMVPDGVEVKHSIEPNVKTKFHF